MIVEELRADLDELEGLLKEDPSGRRGLVLQPLRPPPQAVDPARLVAPLEGQAWSTPGSTAVARAFRRTLRTIAPLVISDLFALALCGLAAQVLVRYLHPAAAELLGHAAPFALLPLVAAYWLSDLYSEIWVHPVIEFRQLTRISTVGLIAAAAGGAMADGFAIWCAVAWPLAILMVPLARTATRHVCVSWSWWGFPTLIIGSGCEAQSVAGMLLDAPRSGLRPVLLTDPTGRCRTSPLPVMNDAETLESLVRSEGIRHAAVSLPEFSLARLSEALDRYSGLVPHLLVLSDASTLPQLWGASRSFGRLSGIEVRNGLLMSTLQSVKWLIDVAVAAIALVPGLPLMALIALALKLGSRGPIFYGHTRVGRHGKPFKAWKFRTMRTDGDAILQELLKNDPAAREEWERDHKLRNDPRVTRIGAFLRKTSLDELPQIWNVLKGDMSLVGPRPIVTAEIARYGEVFKQYARVKPGITGLWQVSGRSDIRYEDRVRLDQFYIRHWSPWLDVYILAKTIVALVDRDGAY